MKPNQTKPIKFIHSYHYRLMADNHHRRRADSTEFPDSLSPSISIIHHFW